MNLCLFVNIKRTVSPTHNFFMNEDGRARADEASPLHNAVVRNDLCKEISRYGVGKIGG